MLLATAFVAMLYSCVREYSVRRYLDGFSDAIVPNALPAEQKVEAILNWMRAEPSRAIAENPDALGKRDPEMTLTYRQLLNVCGTATNAFLNLARSSDLRVRRLLLLTPDRRTKHVVAEVLIEERWIIVDPTYRVIMKDARGHYLTRSELRNPAVFSEAAGAIPNYPHEYTYDQFAHVRLARLPLEGLHLRRLLDTVYPGWDESVDWSLLLERESFFYLVLCAAATLLFLLLRVLLAWYADSRLRIPRFRLRQHAVRAGATFFSAPEIKE
ncbi:MAG TPA: transglutaminase domain-containing protein [Candidatus Dormibacteraeota bacterium]|nr:transglutaminase domain-containing protein [Candidatus Dormibacteraeota bacterium]